MAVRQNRTLGDSPVKKFFLAFLTLFATCTPPAPDEALGATYYIDCTSGSDGNSGTSGSPWLTLARAMDPAQNTLAAGDMVYFKGTCTAGSSNDNKWGGSGSSGNYISLESWPGFTGTVNGKIRQFNGTNISWRRWKNFTLTGCIWWEGNSSSSRYFNHVFENLTISGGCNEIDSDPDQSNWSGIFVQDGENLTIQDNYIDGVQGNETDCLDATQLCGAGIKSYRLVTSTIQHNRVRTAAQEGISEKEGSIDSIIRRNWLEDNGSYQLYFNNQGHTQRPQVYENVFICDANGEYGILMQLKTTDADIYNNVFYKCDGAIQSNADDSAGDQNTNLEIYNNIYYDSALATGEQWTLEFVRWNANDPATSDWQVFHNSRILENRYCDNQSQIDANQCDELIRTYSPFSLCTTAGCWRNNHATYEDNSFISNPNFVSLTDGAEDFHLQGGSVAIDAGRNGGGEDIGAYPRGNDGTIIGVRTQSSAIPRGPRRRGSGGKAKRGG